MLDLHGFTVHEGWQEFCNRIVEAKHNGQRSVKVITGQGQMKHEFPQWCDPYPFIREVKLNPDGGSYTVMFYKKR
jgi:DNA-nicking Smr family endonuclease